MKTNRSVDRPPTIDADSVAYGGKRGACKDEVTEIMKKKPTLTLPDSELFSLRAFLHCFW